MVRRVFSPSLVAIYSVVLCMLVILALTGSRVVTVIAENTPLERSNRFIIDAGHGGVDGGATSCSGVLESAINLQIALRLDDLMHLVGLDTVMIRKTDISVYTYGETIAQKKMSDLQQRVKVVNDTKDALLISIHQNYFSDGRYSGAQVFYAATEGSRDLASLIQSQFVSSLNPGSKRLAKKASGIYLMDHIERTGVLIECGFLSNPEEEAKLRDGSYQKKICCIICSVCSKFSNNCSMT